MADIRKIRVMISSRAMTNVFGSTKLSDVRRRLQEFLHGIRWHVEAPRGVAKGPSRRVGRDQALFDVWIHENDAGRSSDHSILDMSLQEISKADVVIVLYTGEAGSAQGDAQIGICHAELQEALARRPEIVSIVGLLPLQQARAARDRTFQDFIAEQSVPRKDVDSEGALQIVSAELLQQRLADLARRGATVGRRKRDRGQALAWARDDLATGQAKMRTALALHLEARMIGSLERPDTLFIVSQPGGQVLAARLDAVPAAFSVAAARERVGQPFLRDYQYSKTLEAEDLPGVVHLIACHRSVTEAQGVRVLGTPDAISVSSDFGVYVADHVQKIQLVFLAQCADETATALAVRRLREWLIQSHEGGRIFERARARRRILAVMKSELHTGTDQAIPMRAKRPHRRKS